MLEPCYLCFSVLFVSLFLGAVAALDRNHGSISFRPCKNIYIFSANNLYNFLQLGWLNHEVIVQKMIGSNPLSIILKYYFFYRPSSFFSGSSSCCFGLSQGGLAQGLTVCGLTLDVFVFYQYIQCYKKKKNWIFFQRYKKLEILTLIFTILHTNVDIISICSIYVFIYVCLKMLYLDISCLIRVCTFVHPNAYLSRLGIRCCLFKTNE